METRATNRDVQINRNEDGPTTITGYAAVFTVTATTALNIVYGMIS